MLKNKKKQMHLLSQNMDKKEFYLFYYQYLMDYLNHLYVKVLNELHLNLQLQTVKENVN